MCIVFKVSHSLCVLSLMVSHSLYALSLWQVFLYMHCLCGKLFSMCIVFVASYSLCALSLWQVILYVHCLCGKLFSMCIVFNGRSLSYLHIMIYNCSTFYWKEKFCSGGICSSFLEFLRHHVQSTCMSYYTQFSYCGLISSFQISTVSSVTNAMKSTISLTSSNSSFPGLRGSTATFFCGWSYDSDEEHIVGLRFTSIKRPQIYYYHVAGLSNMGIKKEYAYDDNRMSTSIVNIGNVTLTLSPLDCVDDDTYRCTVSYLLSGVEQPDEVSETVLTLQGKTTCFLYRVLYNFFEQISAQTRNI